MSEPRTSRRPAWALAIVGSLVALALGGWVGVVVLFPHLGTEFDEQRPGSRSQHLAVCRLRGLTGARFELQLLPDYDGGEPVWRVPLPRGARDVLLTPALSVLRTPRDAPEGGARLEAYDLDSGELVWSLEDDAALPVLPRLVDSLGLLLELREAPLRLRAIEHESGDVRWELEDPAITRELWLEGIRGPELLLRTGPNVVAVSALEGTLRPLGAPSALSVDVCGEVVASLDREGALRVGGLANGVSTEVGRAPAGTVSCVSRGALTLVGWTSATPSASRFDHTRDRELDAITDGVLRPGAPGAVLGIEGAGTPSARRLWVATTRWGGPSELRVEAPCSLGLESPSERREEVDDEEPVARLPRVWFDCATGVVRTPPDHHE